MHPEPKITGELLGEIVINLLKDFGFNLDACVGIGTDGCYGTVIPNVIRNMFCYQRQILKKNPNGNLIGLMVRYCTPYPTSAL